jgi:hypothetical protein
MGPPREQLGQQQARGGLNQKDIDEVAARARAQVAARLSVLRGSQSDENGGPDATLCFGFRGSVPQNSPGSVVFRNVS